MADDTFRVDYFERAGEIEGWHGVEDEQKVDRLLASILKDGWIGAPVVLWTENLAITGVHRLAAARSAGIQVPVVWLSTLAPKAVETATEYIADGYHWSAAIEIAVAEVDPHVLDRYGIDILN